MHMPISMIKRIPFALKGVDAIFYSMFHHLGLKVNMQAVIDQDDLRNDENAYRAYFETDDGEKDAELVTTGLYGIQLSHDGGSDGAEDVINVCRMTEKSHQLPIIIYEQIVRRVWISKWRNDITWFNCPGHKEMAVVHLAVSYMAVTQEARVSDMITVVWQ